MILCQSVNNFWLLQIVNDALSKEFQMNHGGRREGAGRPEGSTNRATKEHWSMCQVMGD